jgi:hypothetical protein
VCVTQQGFALQGRDQLLCQGRALEGDHGQLSGFIGRLVFYLFMDKKR